MTNAQQHQSAFPLRDSAWGESVDPTGLTKREYFAIHVLQGLLASSSGRSISKHDIAAAAIEITDELLKQL